MLDCAVYVAGVGSEDELVVVALGGECFGHFFVGLDPVMHVVAHDVGVEEVVVADFKPDADGLRRAVGDDVLVELPCAVRGLRIVRPLLVDPGAGVGEHSGVPLRVVPGHDESAGSAGAATHGGAAFWVVGQLDVGFGFYARQDFGFDELGVAAGHGVVFEATLAALGVAAAVADGDGDHGWEFMLGDEAVEGGEEQAVGSVRAYDEGRDGAWNVLFGHVDRDLPRIGRGMAGGDQEFRWIGEIGRAEGVGVACDAGIDLAVG